MTAIQVKERPAAEGRSWIRGAALLAVGFGLLTIREGGAVLFGDEAARAAVGQYVPFVVGFNFVAGFGYVLAGIGLWMQQRWAAWLAVAIAVATAAVFVAFGVHAYTGGAYEWRTAVAMTLRTAVWVALALLAWRPLIQRDA